MKHGKKWSLPQLMNKFNKTILIKWKVLPPKVFRNYYIPVSVFSFSSLVISLKASSFDIFWNGKYSAQKEIKAVIFHFQVHFSVHPRKRCSEVLWKNIFTRIYLMSQRKVCEALGTFISTKRTTKSIVIT